MSIILRRKTEKEISECVGAQRKACAENDYPHFAPRDGICYGCRANIYQNIGWVNADGSHTSKDGAEVDYVTGISLEKASTELITGCPHCHVSYCE